MFGSQSLLKNMTSWISSLQERSNKHPNLKQKAKTYSEPWQGSEYVCFCFESRFLFEYSWGEEIHQVVFLTKRVDERLR